MQQDAFEKYVDLSDGGLRLRVEAAKAQCMMQVLDALPGVSTPRLLRIDEQQGRLVFEKIGNLQPLHAKLPISRFEQIGRLLALIHAELRLPEELTSFPPEFQGRDDLVYLHGDFQPKNLAIVGSDLLVFDWGLRPWGKAVHTKGLRTVDIMSFLAPWLVPHWWDWRLPVESLGAFLTSYIVESRQNGREPLAYVDFQEELQSHDDFNRQSIAKRSLAAQCVHKLKFRFNRWRLLRELKTRIPRERLS